MLQWSIENRILELKYAWSISRNTSDTKTNLFVSVSDGIHVGLGEAAPNVRYNETPEELKSQFSVLLKEKIDEIRFPDELSELLNKANLSNALRFAVESAFIHYQSQKVEKKIYDFLNLSKPSNIFTAYSIPIMDIGKMKEFYINNNLARFKFIKIKVNQENALEAVSHVSQLCKQPLIVDANEAFADVSQCINLLEKIKKKNIEFIEQPLSSTMIEESVYLKKHSPLPLFADESITNEANFSLLKEMFDGVNIKLMKAGGYLNGRRLLKEAKKSGLKTMIGCMVETTLAISSAMHLCSLADYVDLDSFLLIKNEPYGLIDEMNGELKFAKP
jgi:L-Ala-D/L-Glu epimerase